MGKNVDLVRALSDRAFPIRRCRIGRELRVSELDDLVPEHEFIG